MLVSWCPLAITTRAERRDLYFDCGCDTVVAGSRSRRTYYSSAGCKAEPYLPIHHPSRLFGHIG